MRPALAMRKALRSSARRVAWACRLTATRLQDRCSALRPWVDRWIVPLALPIVATGLLALISVADHPTDIADISVDSPTASRSGRDGALASSTDERPSVATPWDVDVPPPPEPAAGPRWSDTGFQDLPDLSGSAPKAPSGPAAPDVGGGGMSGVPGSWPLVMAVVGAAVLPILVQWWRARWRNHQLERSDQPAVELAREMPAFERRALVIDAASTSDLPDSQAKVTRSEQSPPAYGSATSRAGTAPPAPSQTDEQSGPADDAATPIPSPPSSDPPPTHEPTLAPTGSRSRVVLFQKDASWPPRR